MANTKVIAEIEHLKQKIETLQNLTKDYTTAVKEKEIELQIEFSQKEKDYLIKIEEQQQTIKTLNSRVAVLSSESIQSRQSQHQQALIQSIQHSQQIQSLKQQLSQQQLIAHELNQEVSDLSTINEENQKLIATKENKIISLNQKLKITQLMKIIPGALDSNITVPENLTIISTPSDDAYEHESTPKIGPAAIPKTISGTDKGQFGIGSASCKPFLISMHNTIVDLTRTGSVQPVIMEDIVCTYICY